MSHSTSEGLWDHKSLFVYNTAIGSLIESVIVLYSKQMSGFKRVLSAAIRKETETPPLICDGWAAMITLDFGGQSVQSNTATSHHRQNEPLINEHFSSPFTSSLAVCQYTYQWSLDIVSTAN